MLTHSTRYAARRARTWFAPLLLATVLLQVAAIGQAARATDQYDIRADRRDAALRYRQQHAERASALEPGRQQSLQRALAVDAGKTLRVQRAESDGQVRVIAPKSPQRRLAAAAAPGQRVAALREFLSANALLYSVDPQLIDALEVVADYRNPDGGLAWVRLRQLVNGRVVLGTEITGAFDAEDRLFRVIGSPIAIPSDGSLAREPTAVMPAIRAAAAAVAFPIGTSPLTKLPDRPGVAAFAQRFGSAGSATEISVEPVVFAIEPKVARLAWQVQLIGATEAWSVLVDVDDQTVLWWQNLLDHQSQPITVTAYADDSPAPMSPGANAPDGSQPQEAISRTTITPPLKAFNLLGWIPDGQRITTGNNVDAGIDRDGVNGIDASGRVEGTPGRFFGAAYNPSPGREDQGGNPGDEPIPPGGGPLSAFQTGTVINAFYWANWFHDRTYELGFVEAAGNFQNDNFGNGGVAGDRMNVELQDSTRVNDAVMLTGADGATTRLQVGVFTPTTPDRDAGLDQEVVVHELAHGLSRRLIGNGLGLSSAQGPALGEGWSDCFARFALAQANEPINGTYPFGSYIARQLGAVGENHGYYGIRSFPYAVRTSLGGPQNRPHNPLTFADIDPTQFNVADAAFAPNPSFLPAAGATHFRGVVWCSALFEARAELIADVGFTQGNELMLQLMVDGMKLTPIGPNFIDARDALLAAAEISAPEQMQALWRGFAARGLGVGASTDGANAVVESFNTPNLAVAEALGISDSRCNSNGYAEPGEILNVSVPVANATGSTAQNATVTIAPGGSQSYGQIPTASSVSRDFEVNVPANQVCGTPIDLAIHVQSSLGPIALNRQIAVGRPLVALAQDFDTAVLGTLPQTWTTAETGAALPWQTVASSVASEPHAVMAVGVSTTGEAALTSEAFLVESANAVLTFKHQFNFENGFDGGVLEISLDGGAYQDLITAGGSFLEGGYIQALSNESCSGSPRPLASRPAWTGLRNGLVTRVQLPATAQSQMARLRWRMGSDCSVVSSGWLIDDVQVLSGHECLPTACDAVDALFRDSFE
ncbi:M36 family metallopeptidase [Ahniella affigens]|nr:M36 family metallopeptidase [Ahniella affigens]